MATTTRAATTARTTYQKIPPTHPPSSPHREFAGRGRFWGWRGRRWGRGREGRIRSLTRRLLLGVRHEPPLRRQAPPPPPVPSFSNAPSRHCVPTASGLAAPPLRRRAEGAPQAAPRCAPRQSRNAGRQCLRRAKAEPSVASKSGRGAGGRRGCDRRCLRMAEAKLGGQQASQPEVRRGRVRGWRCNRVGTARDGYARW
ncbi:hypothetical protein PVAP13_1NG193457 [Panicum virgatum]|uniref:Uncharacterized protein n=1 Tax=Panicum virgatum TaxID=38727 RepID=A0A8T0WUD5_PANVG|nr:hypothetical protein PVAP13_1NG193457 [Panicum virgatum]